MTDSANHFRSATRLVHGGTVRSQHGENSHAQEYTAALELIQSHARLWTPATEPA